MGLFAFRLVHVVDLSDAQLQIASFKPHLYLCMCLHLGAQMRAFICQHEILMLMLLVLSQFVFSLVDSFCMFLPYPWASASRTLDSMERCLRLVARCDPTSQNVAAIDVTHVCNSLGISRLSLIQLFSTILFHTEGDERYGQVPARVLVGSSGPVQKE